MPTLADEERQNQTTARSQAIELRQAEHTPHPPIALPPPAQGQRCLTYNQGQRRHTNGPSGALNQRRQLPAGWRGRGPAADYPTSGHFSGGLPHGSHHAGQLPFPTEASWDRLGREWQGQGLPLGMGRRGLLIADSESYPHLLMAGTSGSGKIRFGLRPLISSALAAGWQVAIFDRSGLDFLPFLAHPNAHTVLPHPGDATIHLGQLYELIRRSVRLLRVTNAQRLCLKRETSAYCFAEHVLLDRSSSETPKVRQALPWERTLSNH